MALAPPSAADHPHDRLTRVVVAVVGWVTRHPWLVVAACLGLIAGSAELARTRLEYHTQRNDLLSAEKECQKRWQKYLDAFGDDDQKGVLKPQRFVLDLPAVNELQQLRP